ncbi:MAG: aspartyl protease family protein [Vicinamibacterales bacterium]
MTTRVALSRTAGGLWSVPVTLAGGTGPRQFVIDTGSERTVVAADVAEALGLSLRPGPVLYTPAGRIDASEATIGPLGLGGLHVPSLAVIVADLRDVGRGWPLDGILGMDVLGGRDLLIDFARERLTIGGELRATGDTRLAARTVGGRRVVAARVDGRPRDLVLDTGAASFVIFESAGAGERVRLGAAGGSVEARMRRAEVAVGGVHLGGVPVVRLPAIAPRAGNDGLLPGNVFSRIFIDAGGDEVRVVPRR